MKLEFFDSPIQHILIKNFLTNEEKDKIWLEIDELKDNFKKGSFIKNNKEVIIEGLTNTGFIVNKRFPQSDDSYIRSLFWYRFQMSPDFMGAIENASDPFWSLFKFTSKELSKVSRYGNGDRYDWHNDQIQHGLITIVYMLSKFPEHFTGGDFLIKNKANDVKTIWFEDNSVIIFPRMFAHKVSEVKSSGDNWYDARFSIQWFVNIR